MCFNRWVPPKWITKGIHLNKHPAAVNQCKISTPAILNKNKPKPQIKTEGPWGPFGKCFLQLEWEAPHSTNICTSQRENLFPSLPRKKQRGKEKRKWQGVDNLYFTLTGKMTTAKPNVLWRLQETSHRMCPFQFSKLSVCALAACVPKCKCILSYSCNHNQHHILQTVSILKTTNVFFNKCVCRSRTTQNLFDTPIAFLTWFTLLHQVREENLSQIHLI